MLGGREIAQIKRFRMAWPTGGRDLGVRDAENSRCPQSQPSL